MSNNHSSPEAARPRAPVVGVQESLVSIDVSQVPIMKNEVAFILVGDERLKAEVLRIQGDTADLQVFEETEFLVFRFSHGWGPVSRRCPGPGDRSPLWTGRRS